MKKASKKQRDAMIAKIASKLMGKASMTISGDSVVQQATKKWTVTTNLWTMSSFLVTPDGEYISHIEHSKSFLDRIARLLNEDDARKASKKKAKVKK